MAANFQIPPQGVVAVDTKTGRWTDAWYRFVYNGIVPVNYSGQTSITTLGTITTGVWNATPIANAYIANTAVSNLSGTNTGDQTITLTSDVTGTGTGTFATTIANNAVTYAKIQDVSATDKILGRSTAGSGDVEEITCTATGRSILDDSSVSAVRTTIGLADGTYTPTLTSVANVSASTAYQCQYMRIGNTVTVSGKLDIDPTLTTTSTQLGISLPIESNLGNDYECSGTAFCPAIAAMGAAILGDATNNRAQLQFIASDINNNSMYFTFTYLVI